MHGLVLGFVVLVLVFGGLYGLAVAAANGPSSGPQAATQRGLPETSFLAPGCEP